MASRNVVRVWCRLSLLAGLVALGGCAGRDGRGGGFGSGGDPNQPAGDAGVEVDGQVTPPPPDGDDDTPVGQVLVYAHSRDRLYSFSPEILQVTEVGPFAVQGGEAEDILDIAIDRDGLMFAIGPTTLYRVNEFTAELTVVGALTGGGAKPPHISALGFIARNEYKAEEVLFGADNSGKLFEIDASSGALTNRGYYPDGWLSSGDVVSVEKLGTYATVKRENSAGDTLVKISFDGSGVKSVQVIGPIETADGSEQFIKLFGLGYWGDVLYGFMSDGRFISIDTETAEAQLVSATTGTNEFWGAGVTTRAPVVF